MASSKNSDRRASFGGRSELPALADPSRFRGHRGGVITMHRALARLVFGPVDRFMAAFLMLLFLLLWAVSLPEICRFWRSVLAYGIKMLALEINLGLHEHHLTRYIRFFVPYPRMASFAPNAPTWWWTTGIVVALFAASYWFTERLTPIKYLLRGTLAVQASALLFFLWAPARFPHTADSYMEGFVTFGLVLISFVPVLFGLTYYIFDFGIGKKALLTAMTMLHLSLFLPLQILLQAIVLHQSVLFMPLLYIVFGLPVDILIVIAFYSWGMSWSPGASEGM